MKEGSSIKPPLSCFLSREPSARPSRHIQQKHRPRSGADWREFRHAERRLRPESQDVDSATGGS